MPPSTIATRPTTIRNAPPSLMRTSCPRAACRPAGGKISKNGRVSRHRPATSGLPSSNLLCRRQDRAKVRPSPRGRLARLPGRASPRVARPIRPRSRNPLETPALQGRTMSLTDQERDHRSLLRVQEGDSRALEELYDRYTPLLYPVAFRILRRAADAEDALQEAWLQVWRRAVTYDPRRGTVAAWLLTVARTRALDRYRSLAARGRAESSVDPEAGARPPEPSASAVHAQLGERVWSALAQLQPQQRQVLEIAYFEGLSQSEVAARLNAPLGTVKSWTRQGLLRLREILPQEEWM